MDKTLITAKSYKWQKKNHGLNNTHTYIYFYIYTYIYKLWRMLFKVSHQIQKLYGNRFI